MSDLILTSWQDGQYYSHFKDDDAKAQGNKATGLAHTRKGLHYKMSEPGIQHSVVQLQSPFSFHSPSLHKTFLTCLS